MSQIPIHLKGEVRELFVITDPSVNLDEFEFKYKRGNKGVVRVAENCFLDWCTDDSDCIKCWYKTDIKEVRGCADDVEEWASLTKIDSHLLDPLYASDGYTNSSYGYTNQITRIKTHYWRGLVDKEGIRRLIEYLSTLSSPLIVLQLTFYSKNNSVQYKTIEISPKFKITNKFVYSNTI